MRTRCLQAAKAEPTIKKADWDKMTADRRLLADCKAAIREVPPDASVILYGSRAWGDAREDSNYDPLVLVDGQLDMPLERAILGRLAPLEGETGKVVTVLLYNRFQRDSALYRAMPFHKNVTREGW